MSNQNNAPDSTNLIKLVLISLSAQRENIEAQKEHINSRTTELEKLQDELTGTQDYYVKQVKALAPLLSTDVIYMLPNDVSVTYHSLHGLVFSRKAPAGQVVDLSAGEDEEEEVPVSVRAKRSPRK